MLLLLTGMWRVLREKAGNAKTASNKAAKTQKGSKMQPHEPISVFQKPEPTTITIKFRIPNAAQRLRIAYACLACSVASLIIVIATDVASASF